MNSKILGIMDLVTEREKNIYISVYINWKQEQRFKGKGNTVAFLIFPSSIIAL